jgi:hypothetical protein
MKTFQGRDREPGSEEGDLTAGEDGISFEWISSIKFYI